MEEKLLLRLSRADEKKPVRRNELKAMYGLSQNADDRGIRQDIHRLRQQGIPICSSSETGGYWIDPDIGRLRLISEYESRIADMARTVRALKKYNSRQIGGLHELL